MTDFINQIFSLGSFIILGTSILAFLGNYIKSLSGLKVFIANNKLVVVASLSIASIIGSLIYSWGIGFEPCTLCWYQRIFMYPIGILGLASFVFKKSFDLVYVWVLVIIGLLFSAYQVLITYTGISPIPCSSTVSCTTRFVYEYGFVTIPLMSFIFFVSIILVLLTKKSVNEEVLK